MSANPLQLIEVFVYCPSREVAGLIAEKAVTEKLAACANISSPVASSYFWEGCLETATESVLCLKTTAGRFDAVAAMVHEHHPDEVPCVTGRYTDFATPGFRQWVIDNTREEP